MQEMMLEQLMQVPVSVWDTYGLRNEPLKEKITKQQREKFLFLAHRTGKSLADETRQTYPGKNVEEIILAEGLRLRKIPETDGGFQPMFACYTEPDLIEVYVKTVENTEQMLRENGCAELLGGISIEELLLAHELFHFYEFLDKNLEINQKIMPLWHIGSYTRYSRIAALSEIAAMEFAASLLDCSFSPYVLDILLSREQARQLSDELYRYVIALTQEEQDGRNA